MLRSPARSRGFTLVELLVVITIITILISMLLPALARVKEQVVRIKCASGERQQAIGLTAYAVDYKQHYPNFVTRYPTGIGPANADPGSTDIRSILIQYGNNSTRLWDCPGQPFVVATSPTVFSNASLYQEAYMILAGIRPAGGYGFKLPPASTIDLPTALTLSAEPTLALTADMMYGAGTTRPDVVPQNNHITRNRIEGSNASHVDGSVKWTNAENITCQFYRTGAPASPAAFYW